MKQHRYDFILDVLKEKKIFLENKNVIDCACGDGRGSVCLQNSGLHVTAIDIDEKETIKCFNKGIKNTSIGDIRDLEVQNNFGDLFFCSETLEHLEFDDCQRASHEIQRTTKQNGIICITVPKDKNICLSKKCHKTWVQLSDLKRWFVNCDFIFIGEFFKSNKSKGSNLVVVLRN